MTHKIYIEQEDGEIRTIEISESDDQQSTKKMTMIANPMASKKIRSPDCKKFMKPFAYIHVMRSVRSKILVMSKSKKLNLNLA